MSLRQLLVGTLLALTALAGGCGGSDERAADSRPTPRADDRVIASAGAGSTGGASCRPGEYALALGGGRRARIRITRGARDSPRALVLVLHGAGGSSRDGLWAFRAAWKEPGLVLVAPAARGTTWSALNHEVDSDLETVNRALARAYARCRIDRRRVAVGGFSDGGTYALSLGVQNGDIFRSVMALSPGFVLSEHHVGKPRVFLAHGTRDRVLPISSTSNEIVRKLRAAGYSVTYRKFPGGHEVPATISRAAVRWFLRG
jgi:predicted esterase